MIPGSVDFEKPWDHRQYIQMALHGPLARADSPFAWRVAVPFLAERLPFGLELNFLLITFVSLTLTCIALYYVARRLGFSKALSLAGMLFFVSLGWAAKFLLHDFWLVDATSFLFITLAIYCIVTGKDWGFVLLLAVGVTVKESVLFVVPLYYSFNAQRLVDARLAARTLLLAVPGLLVLALLRAVIPAGEIRYSYWALLNSLGLYRLQSLGSLQLLQEYSVYAFGLAVPFLPFLAFRENRSLGLRFSPFVVLVYSQLLFAVNTERLVVAGSPALILRSLGRLRTWSKRFHVSEGYWMLGPALLYLLLLRKPDQVSLPLETQAVSLAVAAIVIALASFGPSLITRARSVEA